MKNKMFFLALLIFTLLVSACAPAAAPTPAPAPRAAAAPALAAPAMPSSAPAEGLPTDNTSQNTSAKRIVIKNATLSIVVKNPALSVTAIGQMAESMGGFVVSSNVQTYQGQDDITYPQASISIRVPASQLNLALTQIKAQVSDLGKGIIDEQVSGSDVTKEYTDLQSRLTNLQNASDQLKAIMNKASKTEDVMSVYNQLTQVNEQIEVLKGQIKYYDEAANLSEISVTLKSEDSIKPISVAGWEPAGIARDAVQALINTLQVLTNLIIWLGLYFLPILLILALLVTLLTVFVRAVLKYFKRPQKPQNPPAA
jgi:hypothetical protein